MARILVINDDDELLDIYEDVLRSMGHEPVTNLGSMCPAARRGPGNVDAADSARIEAVQVTGASCNATGVLCTPHG